MSRVPLLWPQRSSVKNVNQRLVDVIAQELVRYGHNSDSNLGVDMIIKWQWPNDQVRRRPRQAGDQFYEQ